jgi:hypothetical protein
MGITAEFTVGCIGVLTAGATTMELDGEHRRTACAARLQVLSSSLCRGSVIRDCQRKHPDPGKSPSCASVALRTRIVSVAGIRLDHRKSVRPFKGIFCPDISEFESRMPSHAVGLSQVRIPQSYAQSGARL